MFAAAAVVLTVMLATHCHSLSASEFEKSVGTCGVSPNEHFDSRADARANEFPWNVQLFYTLGGNIQKNRTMCEGTIISRNHVVTTAYCLQSPALKKLSARLTFVRIGDWDRGSSWFTDIPVSKILVHDQFDNNVRTQRNNIGLVKLESDIEFGDASQPICLPLSDSLRSKSYANDKLITTGWGQTETERRATKKQKVRVSVVPTDQCVKNYVNTVDERAIGEGHICAGGEHGFDTCAGYAGAPLMALDESSGHWTLVGLTSLGPARCATTGVPAIYIRVGTHTNWILDNIEI